MMNLKNYKRKFSDGFSLLEAVAAIALAAIIVVSVLDLLSLMREKTYAAHRSTEPLWLVKNYWYETERLLASAQKNQKNTFVKQDKNGTLKLTIEIKKNEEEGKDPEKLANLEIILLTAISSLGQRTFEDRLFFCKAVLDSELEEKQKKNKI